MKKKNKKATKPPTATIEIPEAPKMGRPPKFTDEMVRKILLLAAKGLTEIEISSIVEIDPSTLTRWKRSRDFSTSLKDARMEADELVRASLLSRAIGYDYEEEFATKDGAVSCKRVAHPDVTACIFWLKNRDPKRWRGTGDGEDEGKTVKNLFQLFVSVRDKEQAMIRGGKDQLEVLFGDDFVKTQKKKQIK